MDPIDQKTLQQIYAELPEEIRDILAAPETYTTIDAIAAKYGIDGAERGLLTQATSRILLGTLKPTEYVSTIIRYLNLDQAQAALVAQEINRDIFNPIKDKLKELHGTPKVTSEASAPSSIPSPSTVLPKPSFVVPKPTPETEPRTPNNLESKLGGAFAIRKDPLITPSVSTPPIPASIQSPVTPTPSTTPVAPQQTRTAPSTANPLEKLGLSSAVKPSPASEPAVSMPTTPRPADPYRETV